MHAVCCKIFNNKFTAKILFEKNSPQNTVEPFIKTTKLLIIETICVIMKQRIEI